MELEIRDAEDDDGWDLIGLVGACWSEYPGCILDPHGECSDLLAPRSWFAARAGRLWVVEDQRRVIVASVGFLPAADGSVFLDRLYVGRRARNQGLGSRLVSMVEAEVRAIGSSRIEAWSDSRFVDAHRLYDRLGYELLSDTRNLQDLSRTTELHFGKPI